jgi:LacI family transcriptional regulator
VRALRDDRVEAAVDQQGAGVGRQAVADEDHLLVAAGFLHVIDELFPQLSVVGLREGHDDAEQNYRQTRALLEQHPELGGIYNIGGASDGVARALKEAGRDQKVVFIGHGLTPDTRALLIDGSLDAVITQSPHTALMNCVRIFTNLRDGREALGGVENTRSQVIFRENLP